MNDILNRYKVQLNTPIDDPFHNHISTINDTMSGIIQEHYTLYRAIGFLNGINSVLQSNCETEISFDSLFMSLAVVSKTITNIYNVGENYYDNPAMPPDFSLPTVDFHEIAKIWVDYLKHHQ